MVEAIGALAVPVGKLLLKAGLGAGAAEVGGSVLTLAFKRLGDRQKAAEAERKAAALGEAVVADLGRALAVERDGEGELRAAAAELAETIDRHVRADLLVGQRLDAAAIARAILDARSLDGVFSRGDPALDHYRRLAEALAPRLREIAPELAGYAVARDADLLAKLNELTRTAPKILRRVGKIDRRQREEEGRRREETETHESLYRRALERRVRDVTLFGVDLNERTPRDLALSIAYIPLRLRLGAGGDAAGPQLEFPDLLALLPLLGNRLLVEGVAGSGKTTLLQWTALEALLVQDGRKRPPPGLDSLLERRGELVEGIAEHHPDLIDPGLLAAVRARRGWRERGGDPRGLEPFRAARGVKPWHARTPFMVRLRDCPEGRLPEPADLPPLIAHGAGSAADDWVRRRLLGGEALVLLDGIDEVPDAKRRDIRESVENYLHHYPRAQFVATSRPAAVLDPAWGRLFGPSRVAVQPMAPVDIERFVEQWHEALAATGRATFDRQAVNQLTGEILASGGLQQLAQTPLLCAAICYLHRVRQGELPRRLNSLYEKVCELLIHRLDRDRFEREGEERLTRALRGLEFEDRRTLLTHLAQFMVREEIATLDVRRGAARVRDVLKGLRKLDGREPAEVLAGLQERSGVLRGASPALVEFAHNGLRSYLAASRFSREDSFGDVISKALATADPDLPVLAAAQGGDDFREGLIVELLRRSDSAAEEERRRALRIMAARCGATGYVSSELTKLLMPVEREVLPPADLTEAGQLAELGERVLPALVRTAEQPTTVAAASVRCLRLIGGERAARLLDVYLDHEAEEVVDELAQATNPLRVRKVAKAVIEPLSLGHEYGPVRHIASDDLADIDPAVKVLSLAKARVRELAWAGRLTSLERLLLAGTAVSDLGPLAGLVELAWLSLDGTAVSDLGPLAGLAKLRELSLAGTAVSDLGPLAGLVGLRGLSLERTAVSDLGPLAGLAGLERLWLAGTAVSDLGPLAGVAGLRGLSLAGTAVSDLGPLAGLVGLERLSLAGTAATDLRPLAKLRKLRYVSVKNAKVAPDHPTLKELRGRGVEVAI